MRLAKQDPPENPASFSEPPRLGLWAIRLGEPIGQNPLRWRDVKLLSVSRMACVVAYRCPPPTYASSDLHV